MDESALRMAIANFGASRSSFHWWLEFFTVLVVLGVICEVAFVVLEFREDLHDFRRGIVHPPDKPSVLLLVFGLFAALLVAVGVAGEFREEAKLNGAETQIRTANDELYLLLSKEAGDAARSAKTAHDEANAVKGIADASKKDAEDALAKAQMAQRELARSEDDAAKAQTVASNALRTANEAGQVVQQQARVIRALELEVQLVVNTEPSAVDQYPQSPFNLQNVAALSTSDGRTLYLVNDSRTYEYQQLSLTQRKFRIIFHPYTTGDVLGHQVDILREYVQFDSGYSGLIQDSKTKLVLAPADMQLTVKINGLQVRVLNRQISYDSLLGQEFKISVRDEFSTIPDDYSKANMAK